MRLTATLACPRIDLVRYKEASHRFYSWCLAQALRQWLINTRDTIPVYSGASRETFTPLASQVEFGLMNSTGTGGRYSFTYNTNLKHLVINEYFNANLFKSPSGRQYFHLTNPGPYHFQERGRAAFFADLASMSQYPVKPFVTTKLIKV